MTPDGACGAVGRSHALPNSTQAPTVITPHDPPPPQHHMSGKRTVCMRHQLHLPELDLIQASVGTAYT